LRDRFGARENSRELFSTSHTTGPVLRGQLHPWGNAPPTAARLNYCDKNCAAALSTEHLAIWNENNWIDRGADDGFAATAPVGSFAAGDNALGIKDAAGNVWELTTTETKRGIVQLRGGSWAYTPGWMRASMYNQIAVTTVDDGVGFRCVR
jgi:formylglycine-generating enzyme required for sulfatase activity